MSVALAALPTDNAPTPASKAIANVFMVPPPHKILPSRLTKLRGGFRSEGTGLARSVPLRARLYRGGTIQSFGEQRSDRLVILRRASIVAVDTAAVGDGAFIDEDAIGLRAQGLAHHRCQFSAHAGGPSQSA